MKAKACQVAFAATRGLSQRAACRWLGISRSTIYRDRLMVQRDGPLLAKMRVFARRYPRWGYRRIQVLMQRDGHHLSLNRAHRLWKKAGLQVPARRRRRRGGKRDPITMTASRPNQIWAYDFVFDSCIDGQKLKCLTVVDEFTPRMFGARCFVWDSLKTRHRCA